MASEDSHDSDMKPKVCRNCFEIFDSDDMITNHACRGKKATVCGVCFLVFKDDKDLAEHMLSQHNNDEGVEDMITDPDADILSRMECENDVKPFVCDLCGDAFTSLETFNEHTLSHVEAKPMVCDVCGLVFGELDTYTDHVKIHKPQTRQKQQQQQQQIDELNDEAKIQPSKLYLCPQCNKTFVSKYNLDRHMKAHVDSSKYHTCTICQKTFNQKSSLKSHIEGHKMYTCGTCKRTFNLKEDLNVHMLVHSEHGSFLCGKCNTAFSENAKLESHLLLSHGVVVKTIVLPIRKQREDLSSALCSKDVQNIVSEPELREDKEKVVIGSSKELQSYRCLYCPKKFTDPVAFATHKHPGVKFFKCKICKHRFLKTK